jgi:hypothetical protein
MKKDITASDDATEIAFVVVGIVFLSITAIFIH